MNKKFLLLIAVFSFAILLISVLVGRTNFSVEKENSEPIAKISMQDYNIILPSTDFILGQNFVVGISGKTLDEETKKFLQQIKPAGIILYSRNYQTRDQLKNLIAELQKFAKDTSGYYYFIMIDEEPGGATRLNLFKNVFGFGVPEWDQIEQDIKEMAAVGINVDLAPLADFPFNEDTFIKKRIQAHTPEALTDFNKKFIALLQENHISATLKHFPGMGVFVDDPHKKLPYVNADQKIIDESIELFKEGIDANVNFIMTGHAVYDDIDPDVPATLSKKITTDILRDNLGFEGLAITDDLSDMPFIIGREINLVEATAESLKAGHNLVIFSHNPNKTLSVFEKLLQRLEDDQELKSVVEQNYRNVVLFKKGDSLSLAQ
jgi:beta-N-acetylhexosaminidase